MMELLKINRVNVGHQRNSSSAGKLVETKTKQNKINAPFKLWTYAATQKK